MQKKYLTKEQALQKVRQYCAYQERSHYEVQQKLWELGVRKVEHDEIISTLIEEDYLNEERFAIQYAGGKFRMKEWGRKKIYYGLKEKKVSEYNIRKAMKEIDEESYMKTLRHVAEKKYDSLKGEQYLVRQKKTADYLMQKGFEPELVTRMIAELRGG
ncbi:MAG TPA: regulatory protein RecX [Flavisolibacter sp.]|nr:regulatory protein RecX [Flavisolibacter sp.]